MNDKQDEQYLNDIMRILSAVCIMHRGKMGVNPKQGIKTTDCIKLKCRANCPLPKMPSATTEQDWKEAELEVMNEEMDRLRMEHASSLTVIHPDGSKD